VLLLFDRERVKDNQGWREKERERGSERGRQSERERPGRETEKETRDRERQKFQYKSGGWSPHTRRVLVGGWLCGAHRERAVAETTRRLHAHVCEGADENSWQSRPRHASDSKNPCGLPRGLYVCSAVGADAQVGMRARSATARCNDQIAADISCYRTYVKKHHDTI
jgi:hypothetical protein